MTETHQLNILLVGDSGVGKSTFLHRWKKKVFSNDISQNTSLKKLDTVITINDKKVRVVFYDTAGSEYSDEEIDYSTASGCLVLYDTTGSASFDHLDEIRDHIYSHMIGGEKDFPIVLVGTKLDLEQDRTVSQQYAQEWVDTCKYDVPMFEASAYDGTNVKESVEKVLELAFEYVYGEETSHHTITSPEELEKPDENATPVAPSPQPPQPIQEERRRCTIL